MTKSGPRPHLTALVDAICQCGVSFSVWQKKNENNKTTGCYDWSSMVGGDKKKVLEHLPNKMNDNLIGNCSDVIKKVWQVDTYICLQLLQ